jgi:hypothetical protein
MSQASITSRSFQSKRNDDLVTMIREIFAATPLAIVWNALRARPAQRRTR